MLDPATQEDIGATQVDMVDPEVDITRGLLNQDTVPHMVDTLGDPMEDSQEVMLDRATQVDMVDPEVDITRGLLNQDTVPHMVDTMEDPVQDSQEVMVDPELDTQWGIVATMVDMVDTIKYI